MEELIEYYKKLIKKSKGNNKELRIFKETLEILEAKYEEEPLTIPFGTNEE